MKRVLRLLVALLAMMTLLGSTVAYAGVGNGRGNGNGNKEDKLRGYEKNIRNFITIDGEKIRVKNRHVNFDVPPVIKEGRTLIPVRAITEAMGGEVLWDAKYGIATIIKWDGSIRIDFFLDDVLYDEEDIDDALYVGDPDAEEGYNVPGGTIVIYDMVDDAWVMREDMAKTDVLPGLLNGRTFVPLRFISEVFGLRVGWNPDTGEIDIDEPDETEDPFIDPEEVIFKGQDVVVDLTLNGYTLESVELDDSEVPNSDPVDDKVTLDDEYLSGVLDGKTSVTFKFNFLKDTEEVTLDLKVIAYVYDPKLDPEEVTYDTAEDVPDEEVIDVTTDGFTFDGIVGLDAVIGTDPDEVVNYEVTTTTVADNTTEASLFIHLKRAYLETLTEEETVLELQFSKDTEVVTKEFTIEMPYNDLEPVIDPVEAVFKDQDVVVNLTLNGYTLDSVSLEDVEVPNTDPVNDTVTLDDVYLAGLFETVDAVTFEFNFLKDTEEVTLELLVEAYVYDPKLDPEEVTYETTEDVPDEETIDVTTDGFTFDGIVGVDAVTGTEPDEVVNYTVTTATVADDTLEPSLFIHLQRAYLETLTEEVTVLELQFSKDSEVVTKEFTITMDYNHLEPSIDPVEVTFAEEDIVVDLTLNGYTLDSVTLNDGAVPNSTPVNDTVTFDDLYISGLLESEVSVTFEFNFSLGDDKSKTIEFIVNAAE